MIRILKIFKKYLKSENGRIFFSGLHLNPKFMTSNELLILDRTYGGQLTLNEDGYDIMSIGKESGLSLEYTRDATNDYYMATVMDTHHFGNPVNRKSTICSSLRPFALIYPYSLYYYIYGVEGLWMWMFDGKHHHYENPQFSIGTMEERPVTLWWTVFGNK
jgi:hypothetical protein